MDAVNLSDYCMGLDETLGAPPSFDDLFKEFCWDDELDKLNVGAKGSVSTPTIGYTATIDPWETMTIDPSKIMKNPSNTVEETSETPSIPSPLTARETSETPSISSPPTPEFSVPMPLPMPVSVASFVDTSQCLGPPQSTSDLNKAYPQVCAYISKLQAQLKTLQDEKLQREQGFQQQQGFQQPQESQIPQRFQQNWPQQQAFQQRHGLQQPLAQGLQIPQSFQQQHGLRRPLAQESQIPRPRSFQQSNGLQQQRHKFVQEDPSSYRSISYMPSPINGHVGPSQILQTQAPVEPKPQPQPTSQPPAPRIFEFTNTFPTDFVANPHNHARFYIREDGRSLYLNSSKERQIQFFQ
ncbi:hypothetical protein N7533_005509 [Penicillium manginii]|uniref:uncharacterized protein n=1 Tax=Penicillium manginii TaxID=203109 RepID=UPI00254826FB|nr:uncharacterized protein N7533_005509 [Penicillium manginii]KAJ5755966.1 hypothetical protein N7533_005509 [Penicillium manginii]